MTHRARSGGGVGPARAAWHLEQACDQVQLCFSVATELTLTMATG